MSPADVAYVAWALTSCPECGAQPTHACNVPPRPHLGRPGLHVLRVLVAERALEEMAA